MKLSAAVIALSGLFSVSAQPNRRRRGGPGGGGGGYPGYRGGYPGYAGGYPGYAGGYPGYQGGYPGGYPGWYSGGNLPPAVNSPLVPGGLSWRSAGPVAGWYGSGQYTGSEGTESAGRQRIEETSSYYYNRPAYYGRQYSGPATEETVIREEQTINGTPVAEQVEVVEGEIGPGPEETSYYNYNYYGYNNNGGQTVNTDGYPGGYPGYYGGYAGYAGGYTTEGSGQRVNTNGYPGWSAGSVWSGGSGGYGRRNLRGTSSSDSIQQANKK